MCWRGFAPALQTEHALKHIISAENAQFKALLRLMQSSRERRLAGKSLLDGVHLIQAYRSNYGWPELLVVSRDGMKNPEVASLLEGCPAIVLLNDPLFRQLSSVATPTGAIAVIQTPRRSAPPAVPDSCVLLEDLQDPGNLGSIMRSCAAAGIKQIFLSERSVNAWSPRVLRAGMGAHFVVDIYERSDLIALGRAFPGRVVVTQRLAVKNVFDSDLTGHVALVFGNEGAGVSEALVRCAHELIAIPMHATTESLNVAAAAAVCLFERVRQSR